MRDITLNIYEWLLAYLSEYGQSKFRSANKSRSRWTLELHEHFVVAVNKLERPESRTAVDARACVEYSKIQMKLKFGQMSIEFDIDWTEFFFRNFVG